MENKAIYWAEKGCMGYVKLPNWLKEKYLEACSKCQDCGSEKNLEIHRIIRGNKGGLYTVAGLKSKSNNVQVLCGDHHKLRHSKEEGC